MKQNTQNITRTTVTTHKYNNNNTQFTNQTEEQKTFHIENDKKVIKNIKESNKRNAIK
jgi:hypothetical protein